MSIDLYKEEIQSHIKDIQKEFKDLCGTPENALTIFYLKELMGLNEESTRSSFTGASKDLGIDGLYIDAENDVVHIVQTKMTKIKNKLTQATIVMDEELGKLERTIEAIRNRSDLVRLESNEYVNELLPEVVNALEHGSTFRVDLVLWGYISDDDEVRSLKKNWQNDRSVVLEIYDTEMLCKEYEQTRVTIPPDDIHLKIKLEDGCYQRSLVTTVFDNANNEREVILRKILTTLNATQIKKIVLEYGEAVFDANVRKYLGDKNEVNFGIIKTVENEKKRGLFECLNNGIQIVCKNIHGQIRKGSTIQLDSAQIVNGGQTSRTFRRAHVKDDELKGVWVDVTIIEVEDDSVAQEIALKRNFQSAIKDWDLRSNDQTQIDIETFFQELGFVYQRKSEKKVKRIIAPGRLIDRKELAQAILSFHLEKPFEARNKARNIPKPRPSGYYEDIFHPEKKMTKDKAKEYLVLVLYFKKITEMIKFLRKDYSEMKWYQLMKNCSLHILGMFGDIVRIKYDVRHPSVREPRRTYKEIPSEFFATEFANLTRDIPNYDLFDVMWNYADDAIAWVVEDEEYQSEIRDPRVAAMKPKYYKMMQKHARKSIAHPKTDEKFKKAEWPKISKK